MIAEPKTKSNKSSKLPAAHSAHVKRPTLLKFPGLVAIGFYLLLLAGIFIVNVVAHHAPRFYLIFSAAFITAAMGITMMLRWAWALALGAVAMLSASFLVTFSLEHSYPSLVQGLLNLVFFLYLVRTELREKLR